MSFLLTRFLCVLAVFSMAFTPVLASLSCALECEKLAATTIALPETSDVAMSEHCLKASSSGADLVVDESSSQASTDHQSVDSGCDCSSACGTSASVLPMFLVASLEKFLPQKLVVAATVTAPFGVSDHPYRPPMA